MNELSIRTLVPDPTSAEPYRKALIIRLLFRQILTLADSPSVELNDLLSTVASYFTINTGSAEREADTAAQSIFQSFFRVYNLTGVAFSDASGKSIKVSNPASGPADLTYFTFRSNVLAKTVDFHAPTKSLTFESSLRLLQSLNPSNFVSTATSLPFSTPPSTPKLPQTVENFEFTLRNVSHDIFSDMTPDELRNIVITARDTITNSPSTPLPPISSTNLFFIPHCISSIVNQFSATPKMNRVRSIALSSGVMTYTGPLDFSRFSG